MAVDLTEEEWVRLLQCAGLAPYNQIAPLMQKITQQLRPQPKHEEPKTDG